MKLTILGSGSLYLTKNRFPTSFLLEINKKKILLDCGFGSIARLAELGIDHRDIDIIFISHYHTDHFGDCFNLIHSRQVGNSYENKKDKKLTIIGPSKIRQRFKDWRKIFWPEPNEKYPIKFITGRSNLKLKNLQITTFPICHVPWFKSIGIRVKAANKTVVYPGDVGSDQNFNKLAKISKNADILLIESGYKKPTPNHFTVDQIIDLSKKAKVKRTYLTHIKPSLEKYLKGKIKNEKNIYLSSDKMVINI